MVAALLICVACGGSGRSAGATHASFRSAVLVAQRPLARAERRSFTNPDSTAAAFDAFAATVRAAPAPRDEVGPKAAVISAARTAAAAWRAYRDPGILSDAEPDLSRITPAEIALTHAINRLPR